MSHSSTRCLLPVAAALLSAVAALTAQQAPSQPATDPFLWLEDVEGAKAMDWVKAASGTSDGRSPNSSIAIIMNGIIKDWATT